MKKQNSLSSQHRGLDYGDRTDDEYDGPRSSKNRRLSKRFASKYTRRRGKCEIREQTQREIDNE